MPLLIPYDMRRVFCLHIFLSMLLGTFFSEENKRESLLSALKILFFDIHPDCGIECVDDETIFDILLEKVR